jgi:glutamate 5-kinase
MSLKELTAHKHREAETTQFMKAVFAKTLPRDHWIDFTYQKTLFYSTIETVATRLGLMSDIEPMRRSALLAQDYEEMAGGAGSSIGRGGMITKILAAKRAAGSGASTVIAWGREPDALIRLSRGEAIGTLLVAPTQKTQARKQWMADHLQMRGAVVVDAGAAAKVRDQGKSLLPIGMVQVDGDFSRGDVIGVRDPSGLEIARGLANYSSAEARLLCRKPSSEFEALLGYAAEPEMLHRDNLVLMR